MKYLKKLFNFIRSLFVRRKKQTTVVEIPTYNYKYSSFDTSFMLNVNEVRMSLGLPTLKFETNQKLIDCTYSHAKKMYDNKEMPALEEVNHDGQFDRMDYVIVNSSYIRTGEVVGANYSSAESYVNAFLNSKKGHREVLLDGRFSSICCATSEDRKYLICMFYGYK